MTGLIGVGLIAWGGYSLRHHFSIELLPAIHYEHGAASHILNRMGTGTASPVGRDSFVNMVAIGSAN